MVPVGSASVVGPARGGDSGTSVRARAGDLPSPPYPAAPLVSMCPNLTAFPPLVSAPLCPGETRLVANRVAFCWLSSCQHLGGHQGKGRTWGREIITFGGSCSPARLPGPQDTACALAKAGGLKPTQAPLSQGKGGSTLNPGFVFRR